MKDLLKDLGIMKAIVQARAVTVERNLVDLEFLVSWWSTETDTFVASLGEFGPSLEDVAMLTSLPLFGEAHVNNLYPKGETRRVFRP